MMIRVLQRTLRRNRNSLGGVCCLSTPSDETGAGSGADDQGKDAMKEFLGRARASQGSKGIWGQLSAELGSTEPEVTETSAKNSDSGYSDLEKKQEQKPQKGGGRTVNNRTIRKPSKSIQRGKAGGGGDYDDDDGPYKSKRLTKQNDDDDFEERMDSYEEEDEAIPPEIESQLLDHEFFQKLYSQGALPRDTSHHKDLDPIDELLYASWIESFKSPSGSFKTILDTNERRRVQIGKARSMHDLVHYTHPKISGAPKGSVAYEMAVDAWSVIHQNNYWNERQKRELVNGIASMGHQIWSEAEEMGKKMKYEDLDLIFRYEFKKGNEYLEKEKELASLKGLQKKDDDEFVQEETNWDEEAVVDEDQL